MQGTIYSFRLEMIVVSVSDNYLKRGPLKYKNHENGIFENIMQKYYAKKRLFID